MNKLKPFQKIYQGMSSDLATLEKAFSTRVVEIWEEIENIILDPANYKNDNDKPIPESAIKNTFKAVQNLMKLDHVKGERLIDTPFRLKTIEFFYASNQKCQGLNYIKDYAPCFSSFKAEAKNQIQTLVIMANEAWSLLASSQDCFFSMHDEGFALPERKGIQNCNYDFEGLKPIDWENLALETKPSELITSNK